MPRTRGDCPRRSVYNDKFGRKKPRYVSGSQSLKGLHRFMETRLVVDAVEFYARASQRERIALNTQPRDIVQPIAVSFNMQASEAKRGPQRTSFSIGTRVHRQLRTAIKELNALKVKPRNGAKPRKKKKLTAFRHKPWIATILRLVQQHFGYVLTDGELLVGCKRAGVGTEIDFVGYDGSDPKGKKAVVIFELKTTRPQGYTTALKFCFSREFIEIAGIPNRLMSQCECDLIQALCGKVLYKAHSRQWPSRKHMPDADIADILVIHSPDPAHATAYRVTPWMARLAGFIRKLMLRSTNVRFQSQ